MFVAFISSPDQVWSCDTFSKKNCVQNTLDFGRHRKIKVMIPIVAHQDRGCGGCASVKEVAKPLETYVPSPPFGLAVMAVLGVRSEKLLNNALQICILRLALARLEACCPFVQYNP